MEYTVIRSKRKSISIEVKRTGEVVVHAPFYVSGDKIQELISNKSSWINKQKIKLKALEEEAFQEGFFTENEILEMKEKAKEIIPKRVEFYGNLIGVKPKKITIRAQKTRWGSCSSKGTLNFNCLLAKCPVEVLDSVVIHELCHMIYMNHSAKFYEKVLEFCPDYYKWDSWLDREGKVLLRRMTNDGNWESDYKRIKD